MLWSIMLPELKPQETSFVAFHWREVYEHNPLPAYLLGRRNVVELEPFDGHLFMKGLIFIVLYSLNLYKMIQC